MLMLEGTNFSFAKPSPFSNLESLKTLSIDVNFVSMEPQSSFGNLRSLLHLKLTQTDQARDLGTVLSQIGDLQNLPRLELFGLDFSRTFFSSVAKLKSLRILTLVDCSFTRPVLFGDLVALTSLEISRCSFNGPIPSTIGNMTNLKSLNIEGCYLLGPIPSSIGKLMNLRSLGINYVNGNIGQIPSAVGNLSNLESLAIYESEFSGPIPHSVGLLKKLILLRIRMCSLSGSIPSSISNLTHMIVLDLSSNVLNGELPAHVFTIPTLQHLRIQSNQIAASIQDFNATSSRMVSLDLGTNKLTGNIPRSFFELRSLAYLDIGWNKFVGSVDLSSFWRLENLVHLSLSNNNLSVMDMHGEGNNSESTFLARVSNLKLRNCNLTGFPSSLAHLNQMSYLDLSCNRMSGAIPKWIWVTWSSSLTYLNLSHNMLTVMQLNSYVLPFNWLQTLDLSSNQLQGQIPMPVPPAYILDYSNNLFSSVIKNFTLYLGY
ncbi:uncharacterized protein [Lolium perenne]|uniref:uncharacterized protein n=1 Tax=Lolium perenne TaxID=4522 RepID=UPI003A991726